MKKQALLGFCLLPLAFSASAAGEIQGQLNVQITIGSGCTVTNGSDDGSLNTFASLDFGEYPSLDNLVEGRSFGNAGGSSFGVQCSNGTNYSVALNSGQNPSGNQRRLQSAGEFITYDLYQDAGRTTPWGNGANGGTALAGLGTGVNEELIVYGRVPVQPTPTAGTYLDTVLVTVTW